LLLQDDDRGAPGTCLQRGVLERFNKGTLLKERMNDISLNSFPLPMDDSDLSKTFILAFRKIIFQEIRDLLGRESVKINPVFNGNANNHSSE